MVYSQTVQYACAASFHTEQQDVQVTNTINKILIGNILPIHVAHYFFDEHRSPEVSDVLLMFHL